MLYRDRGGRYGLIDRHCPHRRADMSYGWVEETGIRCSYHGWLVDETGRCLEQPYEDTTSPKPSKAGCEIKAYPVQGMRRPAVGLSGPAAGAGTAGVGAVHLAQRLSRDRARRRAVQLVSVPGELHRPGAFRVDARQLGRPHARRRCQRRAEASQAQVRGVRPRLHLQARARGPERGGSLLDRRARRAVAERFLSRQPFRMARAGRRREHAAAWRGSSCACRRAASLTCRSACRPGSARCRTKPAA